MDNTQAKLNLLAEADKLEENNVKTDDQDTAVHEYVPSNDSHDKQKPPEENMEIETNEINNISEQLTDQIRSEADRITSERNQISSKVDTVTSNANQTNSDTNQIKADTYQNGADSDEEVQIKEEPKIEIEIFEHSDDSSAEGKKRYRLREPKPKKQKQSVKSNCKNEDVKPFKRPIRFRWDHEDGLLECSKCKFTCNNRTGLLNHMRMHQTARKFTCLLCTEVFDSNPELIEHKKCHDDEDHTFTCTKCQLAFTKHLDFLLHKLTHAKSPSYRCQECGKVYDSKYGFQIHIETHFDTYYKCEVCNLKVKGTEHYKKHLRDHKSVFKCGECDKVCKTGSYLRYHMLTHTGVKPFQCLYCGKGFSNNSQRMVHTRTHTDELPFECKVCPQKFRQTINLARHMNTHTAEKKYECDICHKKFIHQESVRSHKRSHLKTDMYPCLECGQGCPTRGALRTHVIYKHTDEKPLWCEVCKFGAKMQNHMNRHYKSRKHRNNMYGAMVKRQERDSES